MYQQYNLRLSKACHSSMCVEYKYIVGTIVSARARAGTQGGQLSEWPAVFCVVRGLCAPADIGDDGCDGVLIDADEDVNGDADDDGHDHTGDAVYESFGFWSRSDASLVPAIRGKSFSERVEMVLTMVSVNVAVIMF